MIVLPLIMKNFKSEKKMLKFTQFLTFIELQEKSAFLKIAALPFEVGDLLKVARVINLKLVFTD